MLKNYRSGYTPGRQQWRCFIDAWKSQFIDIDEQPFGDLLTFDIQSNGDRRSNEIALEPGELPRSLLDFHAVYRSLGGLYRRSDRNMGIGLVEAKEIRSLEEYDPAFHSIRSQFIEETEATDCLNYGVEQDTGVLLPALYCHCLVVAQYGFDASELLILYPNSCTQDGEMEAGLLGKAWEFRAPSFAEMMRQLSVYCLEQVDSLPPYHQGDLENRCCKCIALDKVWWK